MAVRAEAVLRSFDDEHETATGREHDIELPIRGEADSLLAKREITAVAICNDKPTVRTGYPEGFRFQGRSAGAETNDGPYQRDKLLEGIR